MLHGITRRTLAFAAGGALSLCAASGMAQQAAPPQIVPAQIVPAQIVPAQIVIDNFAFAPATLTVAAGTSVTWLNKDEEPHTVMSADQPVSFKSPALDTDDKFTFVFARPGTYKYFCTIHSHMVGTVVVN
jgi:plastocyanin